MKRLMLMLLAMPLAVLAAPQPAATVVVQAVKEMKIAPIMPLTGTVQARHDVQLTMGVDGRLRFVAEPGTRVRQGDVVARIDTVQLELDLAEQEAQRERAAAQLRFLESQLRRQQDLARSNALAATELEQTQSERDVAASDLRIAEVRARQIEDQLQRASVRAEFDGIIAERLRRAGEDVSRGTPLVRLINVDQLEVRVLVPLRYRGRVSEGDRVRVFAYGRESEALVRSLVPAMDPRQQAFELLLDIDRTSEWAVGEMVSVGVPLQAARDTLAVPRDAIILRQDASYVFRVNGEGVAEQVRVTLGDSEGEYIAVNGELAQGDAVVVRGGESLAPGQPVRVLDGAIAARASAPSAVAGTT